MIRRWVYRRPPYYSFRRPFVFPIAARTKVAAPAALTPQDTTARRFLFSSVLLPLAPDIEDVELSAFIDRLLLYLKSLSTSLSSKVFVAEGILESFLAILDVPLANIPSADFAAVSWQTALRKDDTYTHSGTSTVAVNQDGFYILFVDLETDDTTGEEKQVQITSSGVVGGVLIYGHTVSTDKSISMTIPASLRNGDSIQVEIRRAGAAATIQLVTAGCRFGIIRVNDIALLPAAPAGTTDLGGGSLPGNIESDDDPVWT